MSDSISQAAPYLHLNLDNLWPNVSLNRVRINPDGSLGLASLPGAARSVASLQAGVAALAGRAGIGVDDNGDIYFAHAAHHRIMRFSRCEQRTSVLPCIGGLGSAPGELNSPRGLVLSRGRLYIADSGNHRVQVIDLLTQSLVGVWDGCSPCIAGTCKAAPPIDAPWDLAADSHGFVYVVDRGNNTVQKFDPDGCRQGDFWMTLKSKAPDVGELTAVTISMMRKRERVLVLGMNGVVVCDLDGNIDSEDAAFWSRVANAWGGAILSAPAAVAGADEIIYLGDATQSRVFAFSTDGQFLGEVPAYNGPVAGLAVDALGRLVVHPGDAGDVTSLEGAKSFVADGNFIAGPIALPSGIAARWHRLVIQSRPLQPETHLQIFSLATDRTCAVQPQPDGTMRLTWTETGLLVPLPGEDDDPWIAGPRDVVELMLPQTRTKFLWLLGILSGDSTATAVISQMRVEYDHAGWKMFLPAIYRNSNGEFVNRLVSLLEGDMEPMDRAISRIGESFSPRTADADNAPRSWLDWLATWLDFQMDEDWPRQKRRSALAAAFRSYEARGTRLGLRRLLELYAGVHARVEEPGVENVPWILDGEAELGFTTYLPAAGPDGAILASTAKLNASSLVGDNEDEYGESLFDDTAHCFTVYVYQHEIRSENDLKAIRAVIDREKPAHTTYELCVIGAEMRVGLQAMLGVDAIVGDLSDLELDANRRLGDDALAQAPPRAAVGEARLGLDAFLI